MKKPLLSILALFTITKISHAQVSAYVFSQSTETYSAITGGTVIATASGYDADKTLDDKVYTMADGSFPFSFKYNNKIYDGCNISSNGFISFGTKKPLNNEYNPISTADKYDGAISAWTGDLNSMYNAGSFLLSGEIRMEAIGVAPNREVVIQYSNWRPAFDLSQANIYGMNFQIHLHETSNRISVKYGQNDIVFGAVNIKNTSEIGLRGLTNNDFNNRNNSPTTKFTESTRGTLKTSYQSFNTSVTVPGMPNNGLVYSWSPPVSCIGTPKIGQIVSSNTVLCSPKTVSLSLVDENLGVADITYQWYSSANGTNWLAITSATDIATSQSVNSKTYFSYIATCSTNSIMSNPIMIDFGITPLAGNTQASSTSPCINQNINLSLLNASNIYGLSYQWQSSSDGTNYLPIAPTESLATTTQLITSDIYFKNVLTCGTTTSVSTPIQINTAGTTTNSVPYFEGFENIALNNQLPNCSWQATDLGDISLTYTVAQPYFNLSPKTGDKFASFKSGTEATGNYFYTNGIQLTGGTKYIASLDYKVGGVSTWSEFEILVGSSQSTIGLANVASINGVINNSYFENVFGTFSVPTTGIYYIAIRAKDQVGDDVETSLSFLSFDDINVIVAPPCTLTPVAGIITGSSTVNSGSVNSFTVSPTTGNIQWYSSSNATGPWNKIRFATSATSQTLINIGSGITYYTAISSILGCFNDTADVPFQVNISFLGDHVCDAMPLNIGKSGPFSLLGSSTQTGEVTPPVTGFKTNTGWADNNLNNTIWFKFTAPSSGNVSIQAPSAMVDYNDSQLALWSVTNCASLMNQVNPNMPLDLKLIAANDDDANFQTNQGAQYSSYIRAACLNPNETYYIQLDSYKNASIGDSTTIIITDLGTYNASFTGLLPLYCLPANSSTLTPGSAGGIFSVNQSTMAVNTFSPISIGTNTITYSNASIACVTSSTTIVSVTPTITALFTNSTICAGSTTSLTVTGADSYTVNPDIAINTIITPTASSQYTVTGEKNGCLNTYTTGFNYKQSPVVAIAATSTLVCSDINDGGNVDLTVTTTATSYSWSTGENTNIINIAPLVPTTYSIIVSDGVCDKSASIFIDVQICSSINEILASQIQIYPNPMKDYLKISFANNSSPKLSVEIYDALGQLVIKQSLTDNNNSISTEHLSNGVYLYKFVENNTPVKIGKIIKQ